jgi:hypothetical protein
MPTYNIIVTAFVGREPFPDINLTFTAF